jgi:hypothetical protein
MGNLFGLIETHTLSFGILNGTKHELTVCLEFKTVPCLFLICLELTAGDSVVLFVIRLASNHAFLQQPLGLI